MDDGRFMIEILFPKAPKFLVLCEVYSHTNIQNIEDTYLGAKPPFLKTDWYTDAKCSPSNLIQNMDTTTMGMLGATFGTKLYVDISMSS
jgi:hypothetical protein